MTKLEQKIKTLKELQQERLTASLERSIELGKQITTLFNEIYTFNR